MVDRDLRGSIMRDGRKLMEPVVYHLDNVTERDRRFVRAMAGIGLVLRASAFATTLAVIFRQGMLSIEYFPLSGHELPRPVYAATAVVAAIGGIGVAGWVGKRVHESWIDRSIIPYLCENCCVEEVPGMKGDDDGQ